MGIALLAIPGIELAAATSDGSNPPAARGSAGVGADSAARLRKRKKASSETAADVNTAGAKGATAGESKRGPVSPTQPSASLLTALKTKKQSWLVIQLHPDGKAGLLAATEPEKQRRKPQAHGRSRHRDEEDVAASQAKPARMIAGLPEIASPPPATNQAAFSNAPPSPRTDIYGSLADNPAVAPPAMNSPVSAIPAPGADALDQPREPVDLTAVSTPLARPLALPSSSVRGGIGALPAMTGGRIPLVLAGPEAPAVIGTLPGSLARRGGAFNSERLLICSCVSGLAALLLSIFGPMWLRRQHRAPWLAYTEDWVDGFLWRWNWRKAEIANLRAFCPACHSEVILRPVSTRHNAASPGSLGTWVYCPHCKEATHLEMSDVPKTVSEALTRKKDSGEYQEKDAASKGKAANSRGRAFRIRPAP